MDALEGGEDGRRRCAWGARDPLYRRYHDAEWGRPVTGDAALFERACLEGFQSGLSWLTILRKRENFRAAFQGFRPEAVARFGPDERARLLGDAGIVRHAGKIDAAIANAARALDLQREFGSLAAFFWAHEPPPDERPDAVTGEWIAANPFTPRSAALSAALKRRGWRFVGPTTMHALMEAVGIVNDHAEGCWVREAVERERAALRRPEGTSAARRALGLQA